MRREVLHLERAADKQAGSGGPLAPLAAREVGACAVGSRLQDMLPLPHHLALRGPAVPPCRDKLRDLVKKVKY